MTKSTKHRPWPAMAHSKLTSWEPAHSSLRRDAAPKPQIDLDDIAFLPEQHRPPPPEPTTRLLRDVSVCGGAAALLFAAFAFISVTMPPDVPQGVCHPSTNQCPVGHLGVTLARRPRQLRSPCRCQRHLVCRPHQRAARIAAHSCSRYSAQRSRSPGELQCGSSLAPV
jgi:hypothetical protein